MQRLAIFLLLLVKENSIMIFERRKIMEMVYSYVKREYVEYEPPVDHDAYDEYEDQEFYI